MAEICGAMASGIAIAQLAASITKSIITIKESWSQVQDAPVEINNLIRQIDSLNLILQHIEDDQSREDMPQLSSANLCVRQSLELCQEGAAELAGLANDLAQKIQGKSGLRKKLGSARIVLKKEDVKKLKSRMKNAIQLLSLSYQVHTNAMVLLQPEIIVARLSNHLTSITAIDTTCLEPNQRQSKDEASKDLITRQYDVWTSSSSWMRFLVGQFEFRSRVKTYKGRERQEFYTKYKFPDLLSSCQVDCWGFRGLSGWCINPQMYRVLPEDSLFFTAVKDGDTLSVQQMLTERHAWVTDRVIDDYSRNHTALHVAAANGDIGMCRLLLSHVADPLALNSNQETPLHSLMRRGAVLSFDKGLDVFELYRLLLNAGADEILIDNIDLFRSYQGPVNNLKYLQQQAYPPYHSAPMRLRLDVAATTLASVWHNVPAVLETLLDNNGKINAEITEWTNEEEQTLLQLVLEEFTYLQINSYLAFKDFSDNYLDGSLETQDLETVNGTSNVLFLLYRHFICKLISAGASLQSIDSDGHTLLTGMICSSLNCNLALASNNWNVGRTLKALNKTLGDWLFSLLECGVDLQDYGVWETISSQNKDFRHFWYYSSRLGNAGNENSDFYQSVRYSADFDIRLLGITYGPRPEDWIFWFSEPSDPFAGDFWAMVEGEEHWRMFEKGWFFDTEFWRQPRGWYFDEGEQDPDEEGASIDDLPMPGSWSEEL
ncbi:hypothetical protein F5882DRAFT_392697 [Hyaloscypha sp. PMI_1271]|nr:hypothetical protein F5882DRAFT_392697 [Hyaloscypha sp. PMI_1271]